MANESVAPDLMDDDELAALADFGPAIDDETMERMEKSAQGIGIPRRLTLVAMARDAETLSKLSIESPEAFGAMLADIETFRDHAKALHETAESAVLRMQIIGFPQRVRSAACIGRSRRDGG